ncbi:MAG: hypothetical protein ACYTGV_11055, partial [Planctomycetota bacterium]
MVYQVDSQERLRRVFEEAFRIGDITECLISVDSERPSEDVRELLSGRNYKVTGVRESGVVTGYLLIDDLQGATGPCGEFRRPFREEEVVPALGPLSSAVEKLAERERVFVTAFDTISGIVTRTDLQKPPVRMWLFGMITILEMALARMVRGHYREEEWSRLLSPGRLKKAQFQYGERKRRDLAENLDLIDCLQLSDKGQLVMKSAELRGRLGFESKGAGDRVIGELETLRNHLAHSQDIVTSGMETIVRLSGNVDRVL